VKKKERKKERKKKKGFFVPNSFWELGIFFQKF